MRIVHDIDELAEALAEGGDAADLVQGDGVWRQGQDRDRAADWANNRDHIDALLSGVRPNDSVIDR
jgi:hypothetical protein